MTNFLAPVPVNKFITASCVIADRVVYKNGQLVFENRDGDLPDFFLSVYSYLGSKYPKFYKMDNLSKLGWLASEFLLKDGFRSEDYKPEEKGMIICNASASLDTDLKYYETVKDIASPSLFVYTLPNILIGEICIRNNFKGENAFFVFEQFDANFIEQYAGDLISDNILQACICGWVELLGENYKATLYLVEKKGSPSHFIPFTAENMLKIYHANHG